MEAPAVSELLPEPKGPFPDPERDKRIVDTISEVVANIANLPSPVPPQPQYVEQELTYAVPTTSAPPSAAHVLAPPSLGAPNRLQGFEDLPENILENVSPTDGSALHQQQQAFGNYADSMTLASLTPVSLSDPPAPSSLLQIQTSSQSGFTQLAPMAVSSGQQQQQYVLALRVDGHEASSEPRGLDIQGSSSASDLLSSVLLQNGGVQYIKVEMADLTNAQTVLEGGSSQKLTPVRILPKSGAKSEAVPVTSTADLANNLIATMLDSSTYEEPKSARKPNIRYKTPPGSDMSTEAMSKNLMEAAEGGEDDIYIDTRELCKRIAYELKQHSIPQAIFAERVLCRSQGTLSDLLRNPKPWNKLKSGRETFRRMYSWLKYPLEQRLQFLELWKVSGNSQHASTSPAGNKTAPKKPKNGELEVENGSSNLGFEDSFSADEESGAERPNAGPMPKRPRLVFTDIQKRTLQAIFKETQRPSKEMQQTIAEHLGLDLSTVQNFFMNARRRSRLGPQPDGPAPNQQIRPITPPPESPSSTAHAALVGRPPKKHYSVISAGNEDQRSALIEDTVATVVAEKGQQHQSSLSDPIDPGAPTPPALLNSGDEELGATAEVISSEPPPHALYDNQGRPVTVYLSSIQIPPPPKTSSDPSAAPVVTLARTKATISASGERRSLPVMSLDSGGRLANISIGGLNSPKKRILLGYGRTLAASSASTPTTSNNTQSSVSISKLS